MVGARNGKVNQSISNYPPQNGVKLGRGIAPLVAPLDHIHPRNRLKVPKKFQGSLYNPMTVAESNPRRLLVGFYDCSWNFFWPWVRIRLWPSDFSFGPGFESGLGHLTFLFLFFKTFTDNNFRLTEVNFIRNEVDLWHIKPVATSFFMKSFLNLMTVRYPNFF